MVGEKRLLDGFTPHTNGMDSLSDVVWPPSSVTKTIRGVSYPIILTTEYSLPTLIITLSRDWRLSESHDH